MPLSRPAVTPAEGEKSGANLSFYALFLGFNRRLLAILRHLKPPLSTSESHILAALSDSPGITARDLGLKLHLEKSTLSRVLRDLADQLFITEGTSVEDRRRKPLMITPRGLKVLAEDSRVRNRELELAVAPLEESAHSELQKFLELLADTLGEPVVDRRPDDHVIKREVRRLTRAMGFIGHSCMGTRHPADECQVIQLLSDAGGTARMAELVRRLPYDTSVISRLISRLEARRIIAKQASDSDHRSRTVSLTSDGAALAQMNIQAGDRFFSAALHTLTSEQLKRFAELLERFVLEDFVPASDAAAAVLVRRILGQNDRFLARAFLVEQLVETGFHRRMSSALLPEETVVFRAELAGDLVGLLGLDPQSDAPRIAQLVWRTPQGREREVIAALLLHVLTKLRLSTAAIAAETIDVYNLGQFLPELRGRTPLSVSTVDVEWLRLAHLDALRGRVS